MSLTPGLRPPSIVVSEGFNFPDFSEKTLFTPDEDPSPVDITATPGFVSPTPIVEKGGVRPPRKVRVIGRETPDSPRITLVFASRNPHLQPPAPSKPRLPPTDPKALGLPTPKPIELSYSRPPLPPPVSPFCAPEYTSSGAIHYSAAPRVRELAQAFFTAHPELKPTNCIYNPTGIALIMKDRATKLRSIWFQPLRLDTTFKEIPCSWPKGYTHTFVQVVQSWVHLYEIRGTGLFRNFTCGKIYNDRYLLNGDIAECLKRV